MTPPSILSALRVPSLVALLLAACSNPSPRPSQNQSQNHQNRGPALPGEPSTVASPVQAERRPAAAQPVPEIPARPRPCIDIRPVLMRCKPDERLTHEGCPEPAYMQHCAPGGP